MSSCNTALFPKWLVWVIKLPCSLEPPEVQPSLCFKLPRCQAVILAGPDPSPGGNRLVLRTYGWAQQGEERSFLANASVALAPCQRRPLGCT